MSFSRFLRTMWAFFSGGGPCTICDKIYFDRDDLVQCSKCKRWLCRDNVGIIEHSKMSNNHLQRTRAPSNPCGYFVHSYDFSNEQPHKYYLCVDCARR
jgi:hypothetical protein